MREKIALFESDRISMETRLAELTQNLSKPHSTESVEYFSRLISQIDYYAIPKKFENRESINKPVSNLLPIDKKMKTVNMFINMPIELYIVDTLWTLFLGKAACDNKVLTHDVYGCTIAESVVYGIENDSDHIDFETTRLFNTYFMLYSKWRNGAFSSLERNHKSKNSSILVSLDIKSYFYVAKFDFSRLKSTFRAHDIITSISPITSIMEKIYEAYNVILNTYRKDIPTSKKREYSLPIGLFSSMLLSNVFLSEFDRTVRKCSAVTYYGRYVDDMLFVFKDNIDSNETNEMIIERLMIRSGLLKHKDGAYSIVNHKNLVIQGDKIKLLYIDSAESRAIIDIYNDTIRTTPSQMNPLPDFNLDLSDFDENAYSIENFSKERKLREIGQFGIDSYRVGMFFYSLIYKYVNIDTSDEKVKRDIDLQIPKIEKFFSGTRAIEFYTNWLNYMYFLVITQKHRELKMFYGKIKKIILNLPYKSLDSTLIRKPSSVNRKTRQTLTSHLDICYNLALSIDELMADRYHRGNIEKVRIYKNANMFLHKLVALPLSNYLEYSKPVSYSKLMLKDIEIIPKSIEKTFKFKWTPRFIHFDEIMMLLFYYYSINNEVTNSKLFSNGAWVDKFQLINHMRYKPFSISSSMRSFGGEYFINRIQVPNVLNAVPQNINIAIGSVKITESDCVDNIGSRRGLSINKKENLISILSICYLNCKENTKLLVLPELYVPFVWVKELIDFAKKTQIAIVTGLQYMVDNHRTVHNRVATILPFLSGRNGYSNAFVYIREKNDYSPIEKEILAKNKYLCVDNMIADYQIFQWKGLDISTFVCYELTDIIARALIKGECDIVALPVLNPDTAYFSNIIDSATRDLHAIIAQANTSYYGDSRVTGPYDKIHKDIFNIKGGDNDVAIVGTIEFGKIARYQTEYYTDQASRISDLLNNIQRKGNKKNIESKKMAEIKKPSARFTNKRTGRHNRGTTPVP